VLDPEATQAIGAVPPPDSRDTLTDAPTAMISRSRMTNIGTTRDFSRPFLSLGSLDLEPGSDFGPRYQIESLLGQGGMGKVYRARDRDIERTVALKLVRPEFAMDATAMARFRQELLLASKVSHRNILRIHDLGDVEGIKFISMAFVEGLDLHDAITKEGKLPFDRALNIARQLCGALEAAHGEGVVHRDLKPRNILLNNSDHVFVSDFGLAKSVEVQAAAMTRTGDMLGTPLYMSPEQIEAKEVDHRSDLYSLGLIFHEMVTGDIPFAGKSSVQVMHARMNSAPKNPKDIVPDLPDFFAGVIAKCLVKDPANRYQHASEILHDLEAGVAPKRSLSERLPKPSRTWAVVAAAVVLAVGGTLAVPKIREKLFAGAAGGTQVTGPTYYMAILPFKPLSDNPELKYQAEGIVDALNAKLFPLKQVHLASPNIVDRAMSKGAIDKIARDLGANLLVQGTLQRGGDRIAITVSAWDARKGAIIWQQSFQCAPESLLTTEDDIYNALVDKLQLKLSDKEMARGAARATEDSGAYDLYMRGRSLIHGKATQENYKASLALFGQAIAKDHRFARAYAGIAESSFGLYRLTKDPQWSQKGLGAAQEAENLDRELPDVHMIVGSAYMLTGKNAEAIAEFNRTVELAPNSDEAYRRLGNAYVKSKNKELALRNLLKATEVNPYSYTNHNALGLAYLEFGDSEKALETFKKVTHLEPDYAGGYTNLGNVYYRQGKWTECIPFFKKALELEQSARSFQNLGVVTLYSGNSAEAVKLLEEAAKLGPKNHLNFGNLGDAYNAVGQTAKATQAYQTAIELAYNAWKLNSKDAGTLGSLALYYAKKGDFSQAATFIARSRAIDPNDNSLMYEEGVISHLAGREAEALVELKLSFDHGYPARVAANEFALRTLRTNAEFQKLLSTYNQNK
jgi:eukaryotic-like serine/threonine-protein kinase